MKRKVKDLTGKVVGHLTVVERYAEEETTVRWLCRCECGNFVVRTAVNLCRIKFMSCGCVKGNPSARKDHCGVRYGKVVGIRPTGEIRFSQCVWLWKCDCGNEFEAVPGHYAHRKDSPGCPACVKASLAKQLSDRSLRHGMSDTKAHIAWMSIKGRVFNEHNANYPAYSKLGMAQELADSFELFMEWMGPYPDDGQVWTVGRIDNKVGYFKGNIRWETREQQARNKGKAINNLSGYTGVRVVEHPPGYVSAVAHWRQLDGKGRNKWFSFNKYGAEEAFRLACEYRDEQIRLLNLQGAGYAPSHGK